MIKHRTDFLFFIVGLLFSLLGAFLFPETIEFNFHDTYVVIGRIHLTLFIFALFLIQGLIYSLFQLFKKPLKLNLGLIHLMLMNLSIALIYIIYVMPSNQQPTRYTGTEGIWNNEIETQTILTIFSLIFFVLGIILLFINIATQFLKKK